MTDDDAPAAPEPSSESAAARRGVHAVDAPDGPASRERTSHGAVPRESAVAVGRVSADDSAEALDRLRRAGIPAFLHTDQPRPATVFVDEPDVGDAQIVLATLGPAVQPPHPGASPYRRPDEGGLADEVLAGDDLGSDGLVDDELAHELTDEAVNERFSALMGQLERTMPEGEDGPGGPGGAEPRAPGAADDPFGGLGDPDPPELREEHFERPLPPPMPHPSAAGVSAIVVLLLGVAILAVGRFAGMSADQALTTGAMVTLTGAVLLGRRLKQHRDDSDDGAVL